MLERLRTRLLPALLFVLSVSIGLGLSLLVLLAPGWSSEDPHNRLLAMFARDNTVRRTALASSLGLVVTALVFFRPAKCPAAKKSKNKRVPPPLNIPGA